MSRRLRADFDSRDARLELDRLADGFDRQVRLRLAARLEQLFQDTQRRVHVETGALKLSGRRSVRDGKHHWRARISYGGPTPVASKSPVKYAEIENERAGVRSKPPGTPHKFFDDDMFRAAFDDIEDAVAQWLADQARSRRQGKFKKNLGRRRRRR